MGIPKPKVRAVMSLALALVVASVFTLSSFAASIKKAGPTGENPGGRIGKSLVGGPTGRLIGTGRITVDGDEAQSGTTILSGSTIATGSDGNARIDLGSLGSFDLRPNTTLTLMFGPDGVQARMSGGGVTAHTSATDVSCRLKLLNERTRVTVARGGVKVDAAGNERMLGSGQAASFNQGSEVATTGESVFTAESGDWTREGVAVTSGRGTTVSAGVAGVAALAGIASGVALGVMLGSNGSRQSSTTPKPSTVVP